MGTDVELHRCDALFGIIVEVLDTHHVENTLVDGLGFENHAGLSRLFGCKSDVVGLGFLSSLYKFIGKSDID